MVYFDSKIIKFPRHFTEKPSKMILINELTSDKVELNVDDLGDNKHYFEFDFTGVTLKVGTYKYILGEEVGLLQVGDFKEVKKQYNEKKINKVYER